jgi:hypothetical protein
MRHRAAAWFPILIFLAGCFTADVTVKNDGSGTIKMSYDPVVKTTEETERKSLTAPGITVESLTIGQKNGPDGKPAVNVETTLAVADLTKINSAARFKNFNVKIEDAGEGQKRVEAVIKNAKSAKNWTRTDPCTIRLNLPGEVVETSATKEGTSTVVWKFSSAEYFKQGELKMTAVYKVAAAAAAGEAKDTAAEAPPKE